MRIEPFKSKHQFILNFPFKEFLFPCQQFPYQCLLPLYEEKKQIIKSLLAPQILAKCIYELTVELFLVKLAFLSTIEIT